MPLIFELHQGVTCVSRELETSDGGRGMYMRRRFVGMPSSPIDSSTPT